MKELKSVVKIMHTDDVGTLSPHHALWMLCRVDPELQVVLEKGSSKPAPVTANQETQVMAGSRLLIES